MKIYTLGPDKSFSFLGATKFLKDKNNLPSFLKKKSQEFEICLQNSFSEIWENFGKNPANLAIIPIENTSSSSVHENIDIIFDFTEIKIFAEFFLQINLHLIGLEGTDKNNIKTIYSHPKALEQCKKVLKSFAGKIIKTNSTSQAAKIVRENNDRQSAFIGGKYLVDDNMEIISQNIANQKHNFTRFVLVGQNNDGQILKIPRKKGNKATLIFETKHEAGALAKILTTIAHLDGNLLKIESRPIPEKPHNYSFWIDIDLAGTPENLLEILAKNLHFLRVVGVYEKGKTFFI